MTRGIARSALSRAITALAVVAGLMFVVSPAGATECAGSGSTLGLGNFQPEMSAQPPFFYSTPETVDGEFTVRGNIDDGTSSVRYDTPPGSPDPATDGVDYTRVTDQLPFTNPEGGTDCLAVQDAVTVPTHDDGGTVDGGGVEKVTVQLSSFSNAGQGTAQAPLYILDSDGTTRAQFAGEPASKSVSESTGTTKVPVLKGGSGGTIEYSISSPSDVSSSPNGTVSFGSNGVGIINVGIFDDTLNEPDTEPITVTLSGTGGASVEPPSTFTINIFDNDGGATDDEPPVANFHHPDHGARYPHGSFKANTIHLFATERPTHVAERIEQADIALRRKKTSGNCQWWNGNRWDGAPCSAEQWLNPTERIDGYSPTKALFTYTQYPSLRPSVGTRIRNYTVFGRAQDLAGNWSPRVVGQNVNTFEVTRG